MIIYYLYIICSYRTLEKASFFTFCFVGPHLDHFGAQILRCGSDRLLTTGHEILSGFPWRFGHSKRRISCQKRELSGPQPLRWVQFGVSKLEIYNFINPRRAGPYSLLWPHSFRSSSETMIKRVKILQSKVNMPFLELVLSGSLALARGYRPWWK